jgi:hypothetical protein
MRYNNRNFEEEYELRERAKKAWEESERILQILRTETGKPLQEPTEQEILAWHSTLAKHPEQVGFN